MVTSARKKVSKSRTTYHVFWSCLTVNAKVTANSWSKCPTNYRCAKGALEPPKDPSLISVSARTSGSGPTELSLYCWKSKNKATQFSNFQSVLALNWTTFCTFWRTSRYFARVITSQWSSAHESTSKRFSRISGVGGDRWNLTNWCGCRTCRNRKNDNILK